MPGVDHIAALGEEFVAVLGNQTCISIALSHNIRVGNIRIVIRGNIGSKGLPINPRLNAFMYLRHSASSFFSYCDIIINMLLIISSEIVILRHDSIMISMP